MVRAEQWRREQVMGWLEKQLQEEVIALAGRLGWHHYHTYSSKKSVAGFPDLVLVNPRRGLLLFRELKRTGQKPDREQAEWLESLRCVGSDADVWRPEDWLSGRIERELMGRG